MAAQRRDDTGLRGDRRFGVQTERCRLSDTSRPAGSVPAGTRPIAGVISDERLFSQFPTSGLWVTGYSGDESP